MRYIFAVLLPPVAVLSCGKPVQAIVNLFLTLLLWIPGMIHACFVVHSHHEDRRVERLERAIVLGRLARG